MVTEADQYWKVGKGEGYDIIDWIQKGMDISEIRQKIDANREKLASFKGSLDLEMTLEEEIAILRIK